MSGLDLFKKCEEQTYEGEGKEKICFRSSDTSSRLKT